MSATPWDALLLDKPALPPTVSVDSRPERKTRLLIDILANEGEMSTAELAAAADIEHRQVWLLLKQPQADGLVRVEGNRWTLVRNLVRSDIERAADLLREHGWLVQPPIKGDFPDED
jgi:predicted ArsR family transcriptional regulator